MTLATRLAAALTDRGTDTAFGVPGGGPNLDVVGALTAGGIRFVLAHSETAACIMASTYGYLAEQVCPAIVTRGPGAASAVNGAAQATLDRQPLLLITDTVSEASAGRVAHQRIDQRAMLAPVAKASVPISSQTTPTEIADLLSLAAEAPAGAVHLDYDLTATDAGFPPRFDSVDGGATTTDAMRLIAAADRPVVILGLGAVRHAVEVRRAVEDFGAPTLSTYQGIGVLSSEHRLSGGLFTNGASERALLAQADLVILVGVDPVEPIPADWTVSAPILAISSSTTTDPYFPLAAEIVGDVGHLVLSLLLGSHAWSDTAGADYRGAVRAELAATPAPSSPSSTTALTPLDVVRLAASAVPDETRVTVDAGAHFLAIMPFWPALEPKQVLISNGLATMGYALPAAIGAALARPENPTLCLVGDGGLGMTLAELETVARLDLPITIVVFNDSALSLIEIKQQTGPDGDGHGGAAAVKYAPTDFAAIASGAGLIGRAVDTPADLSRALGAAELTGWQTPRLIDARIDPSSYPHLINVTRG